MSTHNMSACILGLLESTLQLNIRTLIRSDYNGCDCVMVDTEDFKSVAMSRVVTLVVHEYLVQACLS